MERRTILTISLSLGAVMLVLGWLTYARLPSSDALLDNLWEDPIQTPVDGSAPERQIAAGGVLYTIKPLFNYDIKGLIVSDSRADAWDNIYHTAWNDHLNVKDICLMWGQNLYTGVYEKMHITSGNWTCYCEFKSGTGPEDWARFRSDQISNNHLLPANDDVQRAMMSAQRGDQVEVIGYLAEYTHSGGSFRRGTSTVRDDTGNGACETILVEHFEVLESSSRLGAYLWMFGIMTVIGSLLGFVIGFFWDARKMMQQFEYQQTYDVMGNPEP